MKLCAVPVYSAGSANDTTTCTKTVLLAQACGDPAAVWNLEK